MPDPKGATSDLDRQAIDTLRFLAVDMVEKARSGHPGAPLGQAAMAYVLWTRILRHDPSAPSWPGRDRFILSCGHASALLYSLLHLAGYDLALGELERFRQLGSKTPGHPEHDLALGIETTTGPLGQGVANAVGLAMARTMLAARYDREGFPLFDWRVWAHASDGDLMEGVAAEASSLAGHLRLGSLNVLWDDNRISIDGPTSLAFTEDVLGRYAAYGWHVQRVDDGNDVEALEAAMHRARDETARPSIIAVRTHIGFGSPNKQDSADAHGSPLGADETRLTKQALGWPVEPAFLVPAGAREPFREAAARGARQRAEWETLLRRYHQAEPELAAELESRLAGDLGAGWQEALPRFDPTAGKLATRQASGKSLAALRHSLPLVGGSADLTPSNNTFLPEMGTYSPEDRGAPNLHFGVREHAMGAILNGFALTGMFVPYGGTFLIFSDYMRPAIRLAALMGLQVVYVFTHDSIFLGEDGPTHQPISQLAALRAIPNLAVFRPADANETAEAWRQAVLRRSGPSALALSRQGLPVLGTTPEATRQGVARGGYVLAEPRDAEPTAILLATGSEVSLALAAQDLLAAEGIAVRVVSLPCWELFAAQSRAYRDEVLPPHLGCRLAIEAASPFGWERWVGSSGEVLGIDGFGASAPQQDLAAAFGFTPENVAARLRTLLQGG